MMGFLVIFPEMAIILVVSGYNGLLVFLILQISDSSTPSKKGIFAGLLWGISLFANYMGQMIANELLKAAFDVYLLSGISLIFFAIAIVLMVVYPFNIKDPSVISDIIVIEKGNDGKINYSWAKEKKRNHNLIRLFISGVMTFAEDELGAEKGIDRLEMKNSIVLVSQSELSIIAIIADKDTFKLRVQVNNFSDIINNLHFLKFNSKEIFSEIAEKNFQLTKSEEN